MISKMNPSDMFMLCIPCREVAAASGQDPREYSRLEVGITPKGDLILWCIRHDKPIFMFANDEIGAMLKKLVDTPCQDCGDVHSETGEPVH